MRISPTGTKILLTLGINVVLLATLELVAGVFVADSRAPTQYLRNPHDPRGYTIAFSEDALPGGVLPREPAPVPTDVTVVERVLGGSVSHNLSENRLTSPDPELLFRVRPNPTGAEVARYSGVNALGFRGNLFSDELDEQRERVLIVGDSCAFGWRIRDYRKTWQSLLSELIPELDVFSIAQPGHSTEQQRILFAEWFPRIRPTAVVIYLGWNDNWEAAISDQTLIAAFRLSNNRLFNLLRRSRLFTAGRHVFDRLAARARTTTSVSGAVAEERTSVRVPLTRSLENLEAIRQAATTMHAAVFLVRPIFNRTQAGPRALAPTDHWWQQVSAHFRRTIEIIDIDPGTLADDVFFEDGFHPNERGAAIVARAVAVAVLPALRTHSAPHQRRRRLIDD